MKYNPAQLISLVSSQTHFLYASPIDISDCVEDVISAVDVSLSASQSKYNQADKTFSPYNTCQYCIFLYTLSRVYAEKQQTEKADIIYCLNKALHGVDLYHGIQLPKIWGTEHPIGSVMGRATYGDHFFFYQGCTVGGSGGVYPRLGNDVIMYSNSKILGDCVIGDRVILATNSYVIKRNIPSNSLVFGQGENLIVKPLSDEQFFQEYAQSWKLE